MAGRNRSRHWSFTVHTDPDPASPRFWDPSLCEWDKPARFVIAGLELCPTSGQMHWQGYLALDTQLGLCSAKKMLNCTWAHLERSRGKPSENYAYCRKTDTAVGYSEHVGEATDKVIFSCGDLPEDKGRSANKNDNYNEILTQESFDDAYQLSQELEPRDFVLYNDTITRTLMKVFDQTTPFIRDMETFCRPPIFQSILEQKSVLIYGASGTGKTAYALAHFKKPYLISHVDQLKTFKPSLHDGLVFDDMSFTHWPAESCIHILDLEHPRYIHCRNTNGFIPARYPRIFTTNKEPDDWYSDKATDEQKVAIKRRMLCIHVMNSLFE